MVTSTVLDRPARARTRPARLACLDTWLLRRERDLLNHPTCSAFVDVGFGEHPITTLETFRALRDANPALAVIGFELDAARASNAQTRFQQEGLCFRRGGFRDAAACEPKARIIRVMNVLRSYPPQQVEAVHDTLATGLIDGGLLIEGTSDTAGHVLTAWLIRREGTAARKEGLLLYTDFSRGFSPWLLRDYIPRDIRRDVQPGTPIHALLTDWHAAWSAVRSAGEKSARALFDRSIATLATNRGDIDRCDDLDAGYCLWRCAGGARPLAR